jgi:hypothetical protein
VLENPLISFVRNVKKVDGESVEVDKSDLINFEFFVDPKNPASSYNKEVIIFEDGRSED